MRVAIVVDRLDSGLGISAIARSDVDSSIKVIAALEYSSAGKLLRALQSENFTTILFSWRFLLEELLNIESSRSIIDGIRQVSSLGILIPDHLGGDPFHKKREEKLFGQIDFFLVTNLILYKEYMASQYAFKCLGILHDMPNQKLIRLVRDQTLRKEQVVIWVGNSKWGLRQGNLDHKGYLSVVIPLKNVLASQESKYDFQIVDSSEKRLSHFDVLKKIGRSKFLVLASVSEGTALPVLEAMALGTIPITTNVGVASEVLTGPLRKYICGQSTSEMQEKINADHNDDIASILMASFDNFISVCKKETIPYSFNREKPIPWLKLGLKDQIFTYIIWKIRFFKYSISIKS